MSTFEQNRDVAEGLLEEFESEPLRKDDRVQVAQVYALLAIAEAIRALSKYPGTPLR